MSVSELLIGRWRRLRVPRERRLVDEGGDRPLYIRETRDTGLYFVICLLVLSVCSAAIRYVYTGLGGVLMCDCARVAGCLVVRSLACLSLRRAGVRGGVCVGPRP